MGEKRIGRSSRRHGLFAQTDAGRYLAEALGLDGEDRHPRRQASATCLCPWGRRALRYAGRVIQGVEKVPGGILATWIPGT